MILIMMLFNYFYDCIYNHNLLCDYIKLISLGTTKSVFLHLNFKTVCNEEVALYFAFLFL
ncbi:hypothetical protein CHRY9390_02207 [Chryseobacterium aquaeductus]|uniref:Uncharacterized protein n=1 Tax=Chryseobacterium aquaeductus TaxID=2675056 RepID=A0A9N8MHA4_9FLAO|nr:hypothetical protein CHRY9390_02207 [Chryseobacterium potabilaquae]CAD7810605.1 hypothetical protein CHRY9390_02207 [Chryseobacterium aquaeductus]